MAVPLPKVEMNFEDLKNHGRRWRSDFPNLEFLGQIEVTEELLNELCPAAGKHLGSAWNEDVCVAVSVTVVNIAYYAPEAEDDSFRWQVLKRLGRPCDNRIWEEEIGRPTERLLI